MLKGRLAGWPGAGRKRSLLVVESIDINFESAIEEYDRLGQEDPA
jgi:hypothetical protein